ncbi:unnamed protein product [marine sediment metagenome]|uniref:Uncharacterized protein n=1 Tax=marine sediment metagenome TaxID=412755 RepID=X1D450_9ZZZZ
MKIKKAYTCTYMNETEGQLGSKTLRAKRVGLVGDDLFGVTPLGDLQTEGQLGSNLIISSYPRFSLSYVVFANILYTTLQQILNLNTDLFVHL